MAPPRIVADRLYGLTIRPQELGLYGDRVRFSLRYAPMFDDAAEITATHFKLLVLEVDAEMPAEAATRPGQRLDLLKIGWELELASDPPCAVGTLPELAEEMKRLLDRVADTVNELARRAGLEAPFTPEVMERLLSDYRQRAQPGPA
jgi:hypothetical protein